MEGSKGVAGEAGPDLSAAAAAAASFSVEGFVFPPTVGVAFTVCLCGCARSAGRIRLLHESIALVHNGTQIVHELLVRHGHQCIHQLTPMMILLLEIPQVPLFSIAMFLRRMIFLMAVLAALMARFLLRRRRWFRRCRRRFRTMLPLLFIIRHVHIVIVASLFDTGIIVPRSSRCRRRIAADPQQVLQTSTFFFNRGVDDSLGAAQAHCMQDVKRCRLSTTRARLLPAREEGSSGRAGAIARFWRIF